MCQRCFEPVLIYVSLCRGAAIRLDITLHNWGLLLKVRDERSASLLLIQDTFLKEGGLDITASLCEHVLNNASNVLPWGQT